MVSTEQKVETIAQVYKVSSNVSIKGPTHVMTGVLSQILLSFSLRDLKQT